jgi:hypothetical protein
MCRWEATVTIEPFGSGRTTVRCATHNFAMPWSVPEGTRFCPIGQIEEARDEAIAAIEAARMVPAITTLDLPPFKVPNV